MFAVLLLLVAAGIVAISLTTTILGAWGPEMATSAVTVALTITVVDRLIQQEARYRLAPRTTRAIDAIGSALNSFLGSLIADYVDEHGRNLPPIPRMPSRSSICGLPHRT